MTRAALVLVLVAHAGCAVVAGLDEFGPKPDGGASSTSTGGGGSGGAGGEGAASSSSSISTSGTATGGAPCASDVFITEVRTSGPEGGADELVELFNPTLAAIDLSTLRIVGKPLTSQSFNEKWPGAATFIEPMQWVVIGGPAYSEGTLPEDFHLVQSFSNDQVIALVRVSGASSIELDRAELCCDACDDFASATPNPACADGGGGGVPSLHREPACLDGAFVPGPATPFEGPP